MARLKSKRSIYSVHPGVEMTRQWVSALKEKTGRSLDEWVALVHKSGPKAEADRRIWLKEVHKLGTNSAWWIAERSEGKGEESDDPAAYLRAAEGWVEAMFAEKRAGLRPVYDRLVRQALALGRDIRLCPCQTMVPVYRKHVIAQIKPASNTRIDMGFALGGLAAEGRLIDTGGFAKKDRITHRIPLSGVADIDVEVDHWLRRAYDLDA